MFFIVKLRSSKKHNCIKNIYLKVNSCFVNNVCSPPAVFELIYNSTEKLDMKANKQKWDLSFLMVLRFRTSWKQLFCRCDTISVN